MTDEEIKQKAWDYADQMCQGTDGDKWQDYFETYTEGAHSRDEEIKHLEELLERTACDMIAYKSQVEQLRNPWISVEDRLPRDEDYDDENFYCFLVRQECGFIYNCTFDGEEWLTAAPDGEEWGVGGVTHWMPMSN